MAIVVLKTCVEDPCVLCGVDGGADVEAFLCNGVVICADCAGAVVAAVDAAPGPWETLDVDSCQSHDIDCGDCPLARDNCPTNRQGEYKIRAISGAPGYQVVSAKQIVSAIIDKSRVNTDVVDALSGVRVVFDDLDAEGGR